MNMEYHIIILNENKPSYCHGNHDSRGLLWYFRKKCNVPKWKIIPSYLKQIMINQSQSRNPVEEIDTT